jgi:membrane fusion protein (multidrug efflux system)
MFKYLQTLILIITLALTACNSNKKSNTVQNAPAPPVVVDVLIAMPQKVSDNIEANGSVLANESLEIHPEVNGRLTYLNIPDAADIKEGTILARINDAELQASLSKSNVQLSLAEKTEDRQKKLLAVNAINQSEYDVSLNTLNNIKADIELLKAQIDKTIIKAPFNGVLGLRMLSPGAYVTPQTILTTIQQVNKVKIDFSIPNIYASLIKKGTVVSVSSNDNKMVSATIVAIESQIDVSTRNIKARAVSEGMQLTPGSFVKVYINADGQTDRIFIPTNAIIPEASSKKVVLVKNGMGQFVKVETGLRTSYGVEIINGINAGDSVVVNGLLFVKPGAALKIKNIKTIESMTHP